MVHDPQAAATLPEQSPAQGSETPGGNSLPREVPGQCNLQDILPEIKDLAQRVGGLKRLAELVETLQQSQE
ncbi:MAG: hypothetical protein JO112_18245 [Planctomycetes bacterium]|nr:hypothetical protein [Planctomycetota bacterium]